MREISKDNLLRSWKDISAYLGCDTWTCYRWEKNHGMPVHRAEGGEKKSPVFAYKDELDNWFQHTFKNSVPWRVVRHQPKVPENGIRVLAPERPVS